jgi:hypothetical protein
LKNNILHRFNADDNVKGDTRHHVDF